MVCTKSERGVVVGPVDSSTNASTTLCQAGLFKVGVTGTHLFFRDVLDVDQMSHGRFEQKQSGQLKRGTHG
ncbi:MAG: hypothetical protein ACR2HF_13535, partial [Methylococcaceae bacterium]